MITVPPYFSDARRQATAARPACSHRDPDDGKAMRFEEFAAARLPGRMAGPTALNGRQFLPATPADLAKPNPPVPAGFRRTGA